MVIHDFDSWITMILRLLRIKKEVNTGSLPHIHHNCITNLPLTCPASKLVVAS